MEVNNKLYLDADGPGHMAGKYINDGAISNRKVNARLCASRNSYTCKITGRTWVPIMAICKIKKGEEILIDYGPDCKWTYPEEATAAQPHSGPSDPDGSTDSDHNPRDGKPEARPGSSKPSKRKGKDPDHDHSSGTPKRARKCPSSNPILRDEVSTSLTDNPEIEASQEEAEKAKSKALFESVWEKDMCNLSEQFCEDPNADLQDPFNVASVWFKNLCSAVAKAAVTLPKVRAGRMPTREVSDTTNNLFQQRVRVGNQINSNSSRLSRTAKRRKRKRRRDRRLRNLARDITLKIKDSCFDDYKSWVVRCVNEMEKANSVGDTRKIYKIVKKLAGKPKPPPHKPNQGRAWQPATVTRQHGQNLV